MASLQSLVDDWLKLDQNVNTRNEIVKLVREGNTDELERRMRPRIQFGTAGLRGRMEAGWSRMNDLIIIQASQGLCAYVLQHIKGAESRGIVVGHDHRHNSERWARLTAAVFLSKSVKVHLHRGIVHTPMVPFSVNQLNAACGVMITASHNPKQDNGYKVYWHNGVQIIGPHDIGISGTIENNLLPTTWSTDVLTSPLCLDPTDVMREEYFEMLQGLLLSKSVNTATKLKFVNTSMHGVSDSYASQAFSSFGFSPYIPVEQQRLPDPEFPTVRFPNPEEKGALDLAIKSADNSGATYVLAQDPDSDRFSAAEKSRSDGSWFNFTGDQLGVLFGHRIFEIYKSSGKPVSKLAMVASTVSSKMIEAIATMEGFKFVECLTGFKYIGNTALDLSDRGYHVPFGYEEAIGYMFGSQVRDKDGIAATVFFAQFVAFLHAQGKTARSYLYELYDRYGYFQTSNSYFICHDPTVIDTIFNRLRNFSQTSEEEKELSTYPHAIAGLNITSVVDLTTGYDSTNPPTFTPSLPLSSGHMIQFRAQNKNNGTKIVLTLRTSGTEPKIKYYLEGNGNVASAVIDLLPRVVEELGNIWLEVEKHNLGRA
ncbi:hypothetical protein BD779DRAFT_1202307 [Infundibulicybe gibba]|nr:hypothetical protein BD779DRAFT_1202307 [Infundibulicybe gibba]